MLYIMSLHPLQKKPFFVHGLGAITCSFLFHASNIQMTHLHCPFQGWHLHYHKHSHCWSLLCKSFVSHNFYTWFSNLKNNPNKKKIIINIKIKRVFPSFNNKKSLLIYTYKLPNHFLHLCATNAWDMKGPSLSFLLILFKQQVLATLQKNQTFTILSHAIVSGLDTSQVQMLIELWTFYMW